MELDLSGRRAIVTGGSKGLGEAIAADLIAEGAAVTICARNATELSETAARLSASADGASADGIPAPRVTAPRVTAPRVTAPRVTALACDVTDPAQVDAFVAAAAEAMGGIDILVNNAGAATPGRFGELTDADWQRDIEVKLFSQIRCTRAALPHLRRSQAPRVININAVYGRYPDPVFLATSANRASCLGLAKALSMEFGPEGILVNSVNIGFVVTPQWENIHARRAPDTPADEFFGALAAQEVPLGRFGRADEVAGLVTFLASDRASYITGASIDVAGGMGKYL